MKGSVPSGFGWGCAALGQAVAVLVSGLASVVAIPLAARIHEGAVLYNVGSAHNPVAPSLWCRHRAASRCSAAALSGGPGSHSRVSYRRWGQRRYTALQWCAVEARGTPQPFSVARSTGNRTWSFACGAWTFCGGPSGTSCASWPCSTPRAGKN